MTAEPLTPESIAEIRRNLEFGEELPAAWRHQIERLCAEIEQLWRWSERSYEASRELNDLLTDLDANEMSQGVAHRLRGILMRWAA